jgi:hypothetical protein
MSFYYCLSAVVTYEALLIMQYHGDVFPAPIPKHQNDAMGNANRPALFYATFSNNRFKTHNGDLEEGRMTLCLHLRACSPSIV